MKKLVKRAIFILLAFALTLGIATPVFAVNDVDETPIVVYGERLSDAQVEEVRDLLGVDDPDAVKEHIITGQDYATYIDGNPDANMYSSAKIIPKEEGYGIRINIVTPDNITQVTSDMYANALLTAGVENAVVEVASPVRVTGESALSGIYKAYDAEGKQLDKERMIIANEELEVATDLAGKEGLSQELVSELLAEIKKAISEQNPATKEDIEQIINEQLDKLEISLSPEDRQLLIDLFEKMRDLDIDFDRVRNQLEDLASTIKDRVDELGIDEGFWEKVGNFIKDIFIAIGNFFSGLFN